jgi:hypothetical protein
VKQGEGFQNKVKGFTLFYSLLAFFLVKQGEGFQNKVKGFTLFYPLWAFFTLIVALDLPKA